MDHQVSEMQRTAQESANLHGEALAGLRAWAEAEIASLRADMEFQRDTMIAWLGETINQITDEAKALIANVEQRSQLLVARELLTLNRIIQLPQIKGTYDSRERYKFLDVVAKDGAGWLATRDNPGAPGDGDGWQLIAMKGSRGRDGERGPIGHPGAAGRDAPRMTGWQVDAETYTARAQFADGTLGPALDLKPFFRMFQD